MRQDKGGIDGAHLISHERAFKILEDAQLECRRIMQSCSRDVVSEITGPDRLELFLEQYGITVDQHDLPGGPTQLVRRRGQIYKVPTKRRSRDA